MKPVKEAKRYAKTFLNIVGIENAPQGLAELGAVAGLMTKSRDFKTLLVNPGFTQAEKDSAMKQVAARLNLSEKIVKFILHLTEIRIIFALPDIVKIATAIYQEKKKRAKALVMTPVALAAGHEERLKASLKKLIDRDIDLEYMIDPSLLGGVMVKVGSTMYDSSIKGQLRILKDELIKG